MFVPMGIGNATTKYFPLFKNEQTKHHGFFGFMLLFPLLGPDFFFLMPVRRDAGWLIHDA